MLRTARTALVASSVWLIGERPHVHTMEKPPS